MPARQNLPQEGLGERPLSELINQKLQWCLVALENVSATFSVPGSPTFFKKFFLGRELNSAKGNLHPPPPLLLFATLHLSLEPVSPCGW